MTDSINLDNYADLRDISREFCAALQAQAGGHIETVRQLFRPAAVFGAFIAGSHKEAPRDAAAAVAQFKAFYTEAVSAKPLSLDPSLPDSLDISFATPELNPLTYIHPITTKTGPRQITVTAPLTWVLGFPNFPFSKFKELAASPKRDVEALRAFAIHYAILHFVVLRNPRIQGLFEALRFPITSEKIGPFNGFPVLVMRSPAGTARPPDEVIARVAKFAGVDAVEEVLDFDEWTSLKDPFAEMFKPVAEAMLI